MFQRRIHYTISVKFDTWDFCEKSVEKIQVSLKSDKSIRLLLEDLTKVVICVEKKTN